MKDKRRGFFWANRAWYAAINRLDEPEVNFGLYDEDGGCVGEMTMRWHDLGRLPLSPRLECFNDGWMALASFDDLIAELGLHNDEDITDEEFVAILKKLGFRDLTKYAAPESK